MDFKTLSDIHRKRQEEYHDINLWSTLEWAGSMCGEAGEAANIAKKIKRIDCGSKKKSKKSREELVRHLGEELADTVLYADLIAISLGLELEDLIKDKFNKDSLKDGSKYFLED